MKKNILFRTEASLAIGMGHLIRCLSLAKMLEQEFNVHFLLTEADSKIDSLIKAEGFKCDHLNETYQQTDKLKKEDQFLNDADIIVLDGYNFTSVYQKEIKEKGKILVCIDDNHALHFYADAIINVSNSVLVRDYSCEPYTRLCLGSKYAFLREPFLISSRKPARTIVHVDKVFICLGGADENNITLKLLQGIHPIRAFKKIYVVIGIVNPHEQVIRNYIKSIDQSGKIIIYKNINAQELNSLISDSQLAICPASGISVEAASVGIGIVSGYTADNQLGILDGLVKTGCVVNAGNLNELTIVELTKCIAEYISDINRINKHINNQKLLIDGLSPKRLLDLFKEIAK